MSDSSSSVENHIEKLNFDHTKPEHSIYYSCAKECRVTTACVAVTVRESTNDCWLTSSQDYSLKKGYSFLSLDCLKVPAYVLTSGYPENLMSQIDAEIEEFMPTCREGYYNWAPNSRYCYKLIEKRSIRSMLMAQTACSQGQYSGELALINSQEVNDAFVREMMKYNPPYSSIWTGWKLGRFKSNLW